MDARWFRPIHSRAAIMAINPKRVDFVDASTMSANGAPNKGAVIHYFGPHVDLFAEEFADWHVYLPKGAKK
jgi:hypothetical protein